MIFKIVGPTDFSTVRSQINVVDGKMQYLFDENGRRYLDAFGGIATVCCGHCHPDVVKAIVDQTNRLQHSTILYLNPAIADFAEALASKFPGDLKVILVFSKDFAHQVKPVGSSIECDFLDGFVGGIFH